MMDQREFEQRARACLPKLFRVCCAILPDAGDREDAIQEALLRAWKRRGTLREVAYFETWLVRIVINECRDTLRRRKRSATVELSEIIPAPQAEAPDPVLQQALYRMDVKLRLPLVLQYLEGYKIEEIAKMTGTPVGTLKHRMRRAKDMLRAELLKGGYEL